MRTNRRRCGFTLVEMMISMALMALIMVAAAVALRAAESAHSYNAEKAELVARMRGVMDRLAIDVRRSASIDIPTATSVDITLADGSVHSYSWNGQSPGTLQYVETPSGGIQSAAVTLTAYVTGFSVQEAQSGCLFDLTLTGHEATSHASITATPGKSLY
jgi:prepilin-type N-terminal cleavage/methylation domain-containing protein